VEVPRSALTAEGGLCTEYRDNRKADRQKLSAIESISRPGVSPRRSEFTVRSCQALGCATGRRTAVLQVCICRTLGAPRGNPAWARACLRRLSGLYSLPVGRAGPGAGAGPAGPQNASVQPTPAGRQAGWPLSAPALPVPSSPLNWPGPLAVVGPSGGSPRGGAFTKADL
jgi:hypothetical protein